MNISDRFIKYTTFDTQSCDESSTTPSTAGQRVFAGYLVEELKSIGLQDVTIDDNAYVMATLPANDSRPDTPVVGFIAHIDTSPDMTGKDVKACIVDYCGGDIVLNREMDIVLSPGVFPELAKYEGQQLIVTDGTTLLGADDKAGVAAIVSAMEYLGAHPEIRHGKVRIAFTPDEEIGRGADFFDVEKFGCQWAYTVDAGEIGEIEYENFNAAEAKITIKGLNVHPGYAKGKMINASQVGIAFNNMIPNGQRPEYTEGYEGFFHLTQFFGSIEETVLKYIIRDHDRQLFEEKKQLLRSIAEQLNRQYPNCITLQIRDQYYNMREIIEPRKEIIEIACRAMEAIGVTPVINPIRGGTDGCRLSFMGLPCPNLYAGGLNFHGRYEFLPVRSLEKSMETIIQIIQ
ncbi:MAG: peptidase T [Tannerella sp.]|jgi:tripeptide aminopeptidase|nr:peptidase T [Tannerella sp.]